MQLEEQPSPLFVFPSSQLYPLVTMPSPQKEAHYPAAVSPIPAAHKVQLNCQLVTTHVRQLLIKLQLGSQIEPLSS